jgi:hypothetical protein
VLTKKPISGSISERCRFATGLPITTSSWPLSRDSIADQPASKVMNSVTPWRCDNARNPAVSSAVKRTSTRSPL